MAKVQDQGRSFLERVEVAQMDLEANQRMVVGLGLVQGLDIVAEVEADLEIAPEIAVEETHGDLDQALPLDH